MHLSGPAYLIILTDLLPMFRTKWYCDSRNPILLPRMPTVLKIVGSVRKIGSPSCRPDECKHAFGIKPPRTSTGERERERKRMVKGTRYRPFVGLAEELAMATMSMARGVGERVMRERRS
jgi:hypothetical protein